MLNMESPPSRHSPPSCTGSQGLLSRPARGQTGASCAHSRAGTAHWAPAP